MLVLVSDIHLTDGEADGKATSAPTMHPGAFRIFTTNLADLAKAARTREIEIVFLGDMFDVIRSTYWLRSNIRPWSKESAADKDGQTLKDYALAITDRICAGKSNQESMGHLAAFREAMRKEGRTVKFTYLIGNHDWLINRYGEARARIAKFAGLEDAERYSNDAFATETYWKDYSVFARHGDKYDSFNFDGDRNESSLGDALVIDLVNGFPAAVEERIGAADPQLIARLREIDNVRPLIDVPLWVEAVTSRAASPEIKQEVKGVWNRLLDEFLRIPFVRAHDKPWRIDVVDAMQVLFALAKRMSVKKIADSPLRSFLASEEDYAREAFGEERLRSGEARFVVYGHTHAFDIRPLDVTTADGSVRSRMYFNTGTWRRTHQRAAFGKGLDFVSWNVMTFIAFYLDDERGKYAFEVWNGALG